MLPLSRTRLKNIEDFELFGFILEWYAANSGEGAIKAGCNATNKKETYIRKIRKGAHPSLDDWAGLGEYVKMPDLLISIARAKTERAK